MVVYFIISILVICFSGLVFFENIVINGLSLLPIILALISFLQAMIFKSYASGDEEDLPTDNTAYSFIEIDKKSYRSGMKWHYVCKMAVIPLLLLFVVYFSAVYKVILSILIYVLSYIPVKLLVKLERNKKNK